jgi:hypothetical protein
MKLAEILTPARKRTLLVIFTGLVVSWVSKGLRTHFQKGYPSWGDFFAFWFISTVGVLIASALAAGAIFMAHRFFLDEEYKGDHDKLFFYIVMTILVVAILLAVGSTGSPDDWDNTDYWFR